MSGLAVVGHQPLLKPGESFEYTSWTRIGTPHGTMRGTFFCMTEDARPFDATVPDVNLVSEDIRRVVLNLVDNACYAASEKAAQPGGG